MDGREENEILMCYCNILILYVQWSKCRLLGCCTLYIYIVVRDPQNCLKSQ